MALTEAAAGPVEAGRSGLVAVMVLAMMGVAVPARANPRSIEWRRLGYAHAYNLDHDQAGAAFREAVSADPDDPGAYRALAALAWMHVLFRRGSLSVDDYLGSTTQPNVRLRTPPPELASQFRINIEKAIQLAEAEVRARPRDPEAHYDVGAAVGQAAAYAATVDGTLIAALRLARRAFDEHERVVELDPSRKDAGLIIGTYRYVVASLNVVLRWMAYLAGFGGGKERAVQALEGCAGYPSDVQTEARFALLLIYNRERQYDAALRVLKVLRGQYGRNRLLWLETGATYLRAGRTTDALAALDTGLAMYESDPRPKAYGEGALWHAKRGAARLAAGQIEPARADFELALAMEARDWVRGRARIGLGKIADLAGRRGEAKAAYEKGAGLCRQDHDSLGAAEAGRLLTTAYQGTNPAPRRQYQ